MPRTSNIVLKRQAREMVYDVYCFMKTECKKKTDVEKRTSDATKTSISTVRRIVREGKDSGLLTVFKTPGKKRSVKRKVTDIDISKQSMIKRRVHNFHITEKELPTPAKLRKKLNEDINYNGSERSLGRILNNLGFRWKKTENNKKLLIEKTNIRLLRIEYLKQIIMYRKAGRPIVYIDESYIDPLHTHSKSSSYKGQRVSILHAGSELGFVSNALLLIPKETKTGDCQQNVNYDRYEKWLHSQLLPNLPPNSIVVVNNASYNNKQYHPAPTANSEKSIMHKWLCEKSIKFNENMLKPELYKLIKTHRNSYKKYCIDLKLAEHNHTVLHRPPYHPDLNPMEMAWTAIRDYVSSKNIIWNIQKIISVIKEKEALMGANEWQKFCQNVKDIEEDYVKSDYVVDQVSDEFIIVGEEDSDDSNTESDSDNDFEAEDDPRLWPMEVEIKIEKDF